MENNCLITKLKENVDNNSLIKYNRAYVDYKGIVPGFETDLTDTSYVTIHINLANEGDECTVRSKVPMHTGTTIGTPSYYEYKYTQNNSGGYLILRYIFIELGSNPIDKILEIEGIYEMRAFSVNNVYLSFDYSPKYSNGFNSMYEYGKLMKIRGYFSDFNSLKFNSNFRMIYNYNRQISGQTINIDGLFDYPI